MINVLHKNDILLFQNEFSDVRRNVNDLKIHA